MKTNKLDEKQYIENGHPEFPVESSSFALWYAKTLAADPGIVDAERIIILLERYTDSKIEDLSESTFYEDYRNCISEILGNVEKDECFNWNEQQFYNLIDLYRNDTLYYDSVLGNNIGTIIENIIEYGVDFSYSRETADAKVYDMLENPKHAIDLIDWIARLWANAGWDPHNYFLGWYRKGARLGDEDCIRWVLEEYPDEAANWFAFGAFAHPDNPYYLDELLNCLHENDGFKVENHSEIINALEKGANDGNGDCMLYLGLMHLRLAETSASPTDYQENIEQAHKWFEMGKDISEMCSKKSVDLEPMTLSQEWKDSFSRSYEDGIADSGWKRI